MHFNYTEMLTIFVQENMKLGDNSSVLCTELCIFFHLDHVYTLIPDSCFAGFCSHIYNNGDVNVISVTARRSRKCWKWSVTYGIGSVTDFAAAGNLRGKGTEDNIQEVNIQEWGLGFRVNSLGQMLRLNARCMWTICSCFGPLLFILH